MPDITRIEMSVLGEMLERAHRLTPSADATAQLTHAFEKGVELLGSPHETREVGDSATRIDERIETRARFDLLRHRLLTSSEQNERLESQIDRLASESRTLQDALWELHEVAERLKVRLDRRRIAGLRPEPVPMIGSGRKRQRAPGGRLLEGVERCQVVLLVSSDLAALAEQLQREPGWNDDWRADAPLVIVAYGLAALEAERSDSSPTSIAEARPDVAALAALSYRLVESTESIRILQLRETAFRIDNQGMRARLDQLGREVAELEREIAGRGANDAVPAKRRGLLGRLLRRIGPDQTPR